MEIKNVHKTLLVLDLDETLVHATENKLNRAGDFEIYDYHIYKRPYLSEFLDKIKINYLVGVWSSASDEYVNLLVKHLFPIDYKLEFVWGRSRCTYKRNLDQDLAHFYYTKPLKKLKRQGFQMNRILIIDDSPYKCQDNYGNALYPLAYEGSADDKELKILSNYLQQLCSVKDVRRVEKRGWRDITDLRNNESNKN